MKNYAIIVAGGSGKRMKTDLPKQFLLLKGLPVLMHTIKAFAGSKSQPTILLVLHNSFHTYWRGLCCTYKFETPHILVAGGKERFHSVKNALANISNEGLIAVHDGVRPLVSANLIDACFNAAERFGNAIPAVMANESVRRKVENTSLSLNRDEIFLVQTPQVFSSVLLKKAYQQEFSTEFTDDASVVEKDGAEIFLVDGERTNLKITFINDIEIAELCLRKKS
ncbi:2-C-methyl-D-erythritol 4-phosphate cytidylyltransferase [Pedobacter sp. UYP30]|uniref:2-C-methyl-D-erythritol 4-phosphate cytidylyltransferase n=1 Tax=Pedobacter sp. UYP30 TaxID=1756400 RepID=UPI0033918E62